MDSDSHIMTLLVASIVNCITRLVRTLTLKIDRIRQTTGNNPTLDYLHISLIISQGFTILFSFNSVTIEET